MNYKNKKVSIYAPFSGRKICDFLVTEYHECGTLEGFHLDECLEETDFYTAYDLNDGIMVNEIVENK